MRVAVVVPRYGPETGGGAEALAGEYARRLAARMDVTVLTTCALDYRTWADHHLPGRSQDGDVGVIRFPVPVPRDGDAFDALAPRVLAGDAAGVALEDEWMDAQGPCCPGLLEHLRAEGTTYDAVLFIPYLYWTTARGLPLVADRAVLAPALHNEPWLRLRLFDSVVGAAQALVLLTPEERELLVRRFGPAPERCHVVGVGVDPPPPADPERARRFLGLERPYVLCLGRIDPSKGSHDLIAHHRAHRRRRADAPDLVMIGRAAMDLPEEPWLVAPGFVDEALKHDVIAGATALVVPSPYESLSLVLLEAWSHGRPTLCTTASPVLVGQTRRAGGGLWYAGAEEYGEALDLLSEAPALASALGRAGWRFTRTLTWTVALDRLETALRTVAGGVAEVRADEPGAEERRPGARRIAPLDQPRGGAPRIVATLAEDLQEAALLAADEGDGSLVLVVGEPDRSAVPGSPIVVLDPSDPTLPERLATADVLVGGLAERYGAR
jgi:glycosyltransferase involved in cell wall biosynthesis